MQQVCLGHTPLKVPGRYLNHTGKVSARQKRLNNQEREPRAQESYVEIRKKKVGVLLPWKIQNREVQSPEELATPLWVVFPLPYVRLLTLPMAHCLKRSHT